MNRRHFLMGAAAAASSTMRAAKSPNDTVRVACVGLRGRGKATSGLHQPAERRYCRDLRRRRIRPERRHESGGEERQESAHDLHRSAQASGRQIDRRRSRSRRPITSTRCRPSGRARQAKTCTSRSPARTICSKRSRLSRRPASTTAWCSRAARAAPPWRCRKPCRRCAKA